MVDSGQLWLRKSWRGLLALTLLAGVAGCEVTDDATGADDAAHLSDVQASPTSGPLTVGRFEGWADPETGEFQIDMVDPESWQITDAVDERGLRVARQGLYCDNVRVDSRGQEHAVTLGTVVGSIGTTVSACIPPIGIANWGALVYNDGGAFCADIRATNRIHATMSWLSAQIDTITAGAEGYEYSTDTPSPCCGTGANTSLYPDGPGKPTALTGGLWLFGDVAFEGQSTVKWVFRNSGTPFRFSGRLVALFTETENGEDDDCDGVVDNGLGIFADGADCAVNADCLSGLCDGGVCADSCPSDQYGLDCSGVCPDCGFGSCNDGLLGDGSCECDPGRGGPFCDACEPGYYDVTCLPCPACENGGVCEDGVLGDGHCECPVGVHGTLCEATCSDGQQNGDEVSVDCGGTTCEPCQCTDGVLNGDEIAVDCGGTVCDACVPNTDPLTGNVLVFEWLSATRAADAATAAGLTVTTTTFHSSFNAALTNGTAWDLVVYDNPTTTMDATTRTNLINWINGGGKLVLGYWDLSNEPAITNAIFPAWVATPSLTTPLSVDGYVTPSGFNIFAYPLEVPPLQAANFTDTADDGDVLDPGIIPGYSLAGDGTLSLLASNGGNVLVNGFIPYNIRTQDADTDGRVDIEELYWNEYAFLLSKAIDPCSPEGTPLGDGASCTPEDANDCLTYACQSGVCLGAPKASGTSCDTDSTDCTVDTCDAGLCVQNNRADCATCAGGGLCGGGVCGGVPGSFSEDFEGGLGAWTNISTLPWTTTTSTFHGGGSAAQSGPISHSGTTDLSTTVEVGVDGGTLSFWYSTSTESGWDYLRVLVDGVQKVQYSGTNAWTQASVALTAGTHTIVFRYIKDSSGSSGSDKVWIDDITITGVPACAESVCGVTVNNGDSCVQCSAVGNGVSCSADYDEVNVCRTYTCTGGNCVVGARPNGTNCAPADANPCMNYTCGAGTCFATPKTDGTSCDTDTSDCVTQACSAGTCVDTALPDCASCDGGAGVCAGGACGGVGGAINYGEDADELDVMVMSGNLPWTTTTAQTHAGTTAFRAGAITHSQTSTMTWTVSTGAAGDDFSFWYKTSSESNWDYLRFYVDGVQQFQASGTTGTWTQFTTHLAAGTRVLAWTYSKDGSGSSGDDTAYVDEISFANLGGCESTSCGDQAFDGTQCISCNVQPDGDSCTVADPNPCMAYECSDGGCVGTPLSDGTSCDDDLTDCSLFACSAGACVETTATDCTVCGDGTQVCAGGTCGGVTGYEFDAEDGTLPGLFTTTVGQEWTSTTSAAANGTRSFRAGGAGIANALSQLDLTVAVESGATYSFAYRTSSETNWDFLRFYVDGAQVGSSYSGTTATTFTTVSGALSAGTHTLRWEYDKDGSGNSGSDTVWIDDIVVTNPVTCTGSACGPTAFDGASCLVCTSGTEGTACTVADPNPCLAYSCQAGGCVGEPIADGTSCDADATDCTSDTCQAGVCTAVNLSDCTTCGDGSLQCAGGLCGGVVVPGPFDFEAGVPSGFTNGSPGWTTSTDAHGGAGSLMNEDISDNQDATITLPLDLSADTALTFWYKTSTEGCCDKLQLLVNGVVVNSWGGTTNVWASTTVAIPAATTSVAFRYHKDFSASSGTDTVWIDDLSFENGGCADGVCGPQLHTGSECIVCQPATDGISCTVDSPNSCESYACDAGFCTGTNLTDGTLCSISSPVECQAYACLSGTCTGSTVADGTTCDTDATDCSTDTCAAGVCTPAVASDCTTCGDGSQVCGAGQCGGATGITVDFEGSSLPTGFTTDGNANWLTSTDFHGGAASVMSGDIAGSQRSTLYRTVTVTASVSASFWYKTSSESGWDYLRFYIDGAQSMQASGTSNTWTQHSFTLSAGTHALKWEYTKDSSGDSGLDTVWIDDLFIGETGGCESTTCGTQVFDGVDSCVSCIAPGSDGDTCTVAVPNPCMAYTCDAGGCVGVAVADGTTCDTDATDCTTDTCQAGTCVQAAATDCSTCGDGSQQCMNGYCGGADFETYDAEGGSMPAVFVASGTSAWTVQSTTKHAGTYAFQSGTITHSQNTGMTRTVTLDAAGAVTFWYSTSSESGWDKLRFFVDGVERFNDSGTKAWTFRSEALTAGTHTLLWQYTKDSGGSSGTDQVWVDDILITETVAACTADACGDKLWTGSACIACLDVSVGSACTGANPCMSYTCQETTGCTGVAVADGITCDSSATDCQSQTCQSGSCTSANVAECTACVNGGAGTCSATGTCNVPATGNIFSNGAESNALPSGWTTGAGNLAWTVSTAQVHAGTYSFKAGGFNVGNAVSDLSGTVTTTSSAMLSFWFKVETERYWDNFQLVVDGISVVRPNYAGSSTAGLNGWSSNVSGVAEPWQRIAVPLSAGTHTITFRYVKDGSGNGGTTCADTVWVDDISIDPVNATTYDFESGSIPGAFGSTGTLPWGVSTGNLPSGTGAYPTRVGTYAAKAGAITHSQSTGLTYALVTATDGAIMFDWRVIASTSSVSSWTGTTGDTLRFYLDGVLQTGWANGSTSSPWIRSAFFVPAGNHTFEWQFTKDSSTTATSESAWVDNITIAPLGGCP